MGEITTMLPEWLNGNSNTAFPFYDDSVSYMDDNGVSVPSWMILDFRIVSTMSWQSDLGDGGIESNECGLKSYSIEKSDAGLSFNVDIEYAKGRTIRVRSGGVVPFDGFSRISAEHRFFYGNINTYMVFGSPKRDEFDDKYAGTHSYDPSIPFLSSRQIRLPGGVGVDQVKSNSGLFGTDEICVKDGKNSSFRVENGKLRLRVGAAAGEGFDCLPDEESHPQYSNKSDYLYSINGYRPDSTGNLNIKAGPGVVIESGEYKGIPAVIVKTSSSVDSFAKPR